MRLRRRVDDAIDGGHRHLPACRAAVAAARRHGGRGGDCDLAHLADAAAALPPSGCR